LTIGFFTILNHFQGSMPTDGTLLLEHMPKGKQHLVTALSVFFSLGGVLAAVVALLVVPQNSCSVPPLPCNADRQNKGWKYLLITLGLIVCALAYFTVALTK
jgi:MFS family permease